MAFPNISSLSVLSSLKASQLRAVATATGVNSGGTKPVLISLLQDEILKDFFSEPKSSKVEVPDLQSGHRKNAGWARTFMAPAEEPDYHHVLSIDMGIRNLAYCRMLVPRFTDHNGVTDIKSRARVIPLITEWKRLAVSSYSAPAPSVPVDRDESASAAKEPFDPLTYSRLAHSLLDSLLRPSPPLIGPVRHILIERQRYRSMGSSSVQEWTLRVNMFEAMLYAVICTLQQSGSWEGKVWPMQPSKVWRYWGGGEGKVEEANISGKGSKAARTKKEKMDVVGRWLEASDSNSTCQKNSTVTRNDQIELSDGGKLTGEKYLGRWKGIKGTKELGKLDDLADCVLQGVAWVRWEEMKKRLRQQGGLDAFLKELD